MDVHATDMKKPYSVTDVGPPLVSASLLVFVAFLASMFFFWTQDISHSVRWQGEGLMTVDEAVASANQGPHGVPRGVILLSLGGFAAVSLLRRSRNPLRINGGLGYLIIFFLVWAALSIAWADDSMMELKRVVGFALLALGAFAVAERFSIRQVMFLAFVTCGLFLVVGVVAEIALGTFHIFQRGYRFCGTDDPNVGSWGLATLVLTSIFLASTSDRHRGIFWTTGSVGLAFLILSRTRTSFAAVILALGGCWFLVSSRPRKLASILGLIFIGCLAYFVLDNELVSYALKALLLGREGTSGTGTDTATLTGRIPVWSECLSYIVKHPFLGYGFDCFWTPQRVIDITSAISESTAVGWAFNSYIDLVLGVGVVGAGAYVLILGLAIKRSISLVKTSRNPDYAFVCSMLIFYSIVMLTEGIASAPSMTQFTIFALLAQLGFGNTPAARPT